MYVCSRHTCVYMYRWPGPLSRSGRLASVLRELPVSTPQCWDEKFTPPQLAFPMASGTQTQTFMLMWQVFLIPTLRKILIGACYFQNLWDVV